MPVLVGPLLNPINTTMVSVALAPISRDLGIGAAQAIWLVAALYLASAIAQPTMGKLADRFGPKKVFLTGLVIVGVAGIVPEFLTGFGGAVFARVLIGIGTSSAYPAALTTLRQHSARIGKPTPPLVLGALSITSLVSAAAGPPLGGALIAAFGWHAIFLVNVPLAAFGIVVSALWLPSDRLRPRTDEDLPVLTALDPFGMLLMTGFVSALLVFLLDLSAGLWWLLGTAVVLLVALVLWELRAVRPFVDVRMLARNGALSRTYMRLFLVYMLAYTMTYGFSQWVQDVAGYSSDVAGYIQLPAAVVAGVASFLIARKTAVRGPLIVAAVVPIVGGLLLLLLHTGSPVFLLVLAPALFGVPQALASVSNQAALYRVVPAEYIGTAA
ncbi:MFS transporter, partial [Curtobacterium sp. CT11-133]